MDSYEVPDPPAGDTLPDPEEVSEGDGELGNIVIQVLSFAQLLAGLVLLGYGSLAGEPIALVGGLFLGGIGLFLLVIVANARLSDAYRAEEYRRRLRGMGVADDDRPAFVPDPGEPLRENAAGRSDVSDTDGDRDDEGGPDGDSDSDDRTRSNPS